MAALASFIILSDPPRPPRAAATQTELGNPYRGATMLHRIHVSSALLMVPQTVTVTFMLVWLIIDRHWSTPSAAMLMTVAQLLGAVGRIVVGRWSDHLRSRLRPKRIVAAGCFLALLALAFSDQLNLPVAAVAMVVATVVSVGYNGLAATAITENAGPFWSGRALGTQNTCQRLTAAIVPPAFGALITAVGYPIAFIVCAMFPLAAIPLVPVDDENGG